MLSANEIGGKLSAHSFSFLTLCLFLFGLFLGTRAGWRVARVIPSAPLPEFRPGVGATASARFIGQTCAARRESPRRPRIQRQRLALALAHFQPTEARPLPLVRVPHQTALYGIVMAVVGLGERFLLGGSNLDGHKWVIF